MIPHLEELVEWWACHKLDTYEWDTPQRFKRIYSGHPGGIVVCAKYRMVQCIKWIESYHKSLYCGAYFLARYGHVDLLRKVPILNIHHDNDYIFRRTATLGNLKVTKYLVKKGAFIHTINDEALRGAIHNGHLSVVKYLVRKGALVTRHMIHIADTKRHDVIGDYLEKHITLENFIKN